MHRFECVWVVDSLKLDPDNLAKKIRWNVSLRTSFEVPYFSLKLSRWWFQIFLFSPLFGEDSHFD